jgi:hypothetical protein
VAPSTNPSPNGEKGGPEKIPVLVELRYWQDSIEGLIQGFLKQHGLTLDDSTLSTLLGQGQFLLLGLDFLYRRLRNVAQLSLGFAYRNLNPQPSVAFVIVGSEVSCLGKIGAFNQGFGLNTTALFYPAILPCRWIVLQSSARPPYKYS